MSSEALQIGAIWLQDQGYSPKAVAGIIANLDHESGGNPSAVGDDHTSLGLAQWHNERALGLLDFSEARKLDPQSAEAQFAYLHHELGQQPDLVKALNEAKTPGEAADIFQRRFERPKQIDPARSGTAGAVYEWLEAVGSSQIPAKAETAPAAPQAAPQPPLPSTEGGAIPIDPHAAEKPDTPLSTSGPLLRDLSGMADMLTGSPGLLSGASAGVRFLLGLARGEEVLPMAGEVAPKIAETVKSAGEQLAEDVAVAWKVIQEKLPAKDIPQAGRALLQRAEKLLEAQHPVEKAVAEEAAPAAASEAKAPAQKLLTDQRPLSEQARGSDAHKQWVRDIMPNIPAELRAFYRD